MAIAEAAKWVGEMEEYEFIPDLVSAFNHCMTKPSEIDPGCSAKFNIADALYRLDYSDTAFFLRGIRHVQLDPIWGGTDDTAAALRGVCGLALVRLHYPQVMSELADLLADPKPEARIAAARAIANSEDQSGVPLLRLRINLGDRAPVLSECFLALLQLSPAFSISLVSSFLQVHPVRDESSVVETAIRALGKFQLRDAFEILRSWADRSEASEVAEGAALALGESRYPEAFEILQSWWKSSRVPQLRQTGLMAISLLRQDESISFLLNLIREETLTDARGAILALSVYQSDLVLWERVCEAVEQRAEPDLLDLIRSLSE